MVSWDFNGFDGGGGEGNDGRGRCRNKAERERERAHFSLFFSFSTSALGLVMLATLFTCCTHPNQIKAMSLYIFCQIVS